MKPDFITRGLLLVIAAALVTIALRPYIAPPPVQAQGGRDIYIEPGTQMLRQPDGRRQVYGRVMVDLQTGNIWGFPTNTPDVYPVDALKSSPPTSVPFKLGRFALDQMQ